MKMLLTLVGSVALAAMALGSPGCGDTAQGDSGDGDDGGDGLGKGSGDVCAVDDDCPKGERCNTAIDDGVCATLRSVDEGDPCSTDELCESELRCVGDECRGPGSAGDVCGGDADCEKGGCVDSESPGTRYCVDPGSLPEGEPCDGTPSLCEEGLHCFRDSDLGTGACQEPRGGGEGCDSYLDEDEDDPRARQCAEGFVCGENDTCLRTCDDEACPAGFICFVGECRVSCTSDEDCPADGACLDVADEPYCI